MQTHVHLCQTLFRGYADDLPLMDWLRTRVWPMEAAHTPAIAARGHAARDDRTALGGTTSVLTMETVHDTDVVFEAPRTSGIRATIGKCMMDAGDGTPARLQGIDGDALDESVALGSAGTARRTAACARRFAPRFARVVLARAARGGRQRVGATPARSSTRTRPRSRDEIAIVRELSRQVEHRVSRRRPAGVAAAVRRALRLGRTTASRRCSPSTTSK